METIKTQVRKNIEFMINLILILDMYRFTRSETNSNPFRPNKVCFLFD